MRILQDGKRVDVCDSCQAPMFRRITMTDLSGTVLDTVDVCEQCWNTDGFKEQMEGVFS